MSLYAIKRLGLDQVWWLVSPQNPLKPSAGMAALSERVDEAKVLANDPRIIVNDIESHLGTRYTIDTLRALIAAYPKARFVWLMGADNLRQMPKWRDWQDIFYLVPVAVFRRPGYATGNGFGKVAKRFRRFWCVNEKSLVERHRALPAWRLMNNPLSTISATVLRKEQAKWQPRKKQ